MLAIILIIMFLVGCSETKTTLESLEITTGETPTPEQIGPKIGIWKGQPDSFQMEVLSDGTVKYVMFLVVTANGFCYVDTSKINSSEDGTFTVDAPHFSLTGKYDTNTTASGIAILKSCTSGTSFSEPIDVSWTAEWDSPVESNPTPAGNSSDPIIPTDNPTPAIPTNTPTMEKLEPSMTPTPLIYVVQQGDTLFSIAVMYGVEIPALLEANGLTSNDTLKVGQTLLIPLQSP